MEARETAELLIPETKLDLDLQETVVRVGTHQLVPIGAKRIQEQQQVMDYLYESELLPKKLVIQEVLLTPEQYAAITPGFVVSQS